MKHYGDITKLSGHELPVVDVITGGSPCQDLSVAGKRAGLAGERSGLFMEQIRIVKEMRERDRSTGRTGFLIRPRYMVWENVPGAFSSNKGKDFQAVLTEIVKISEPESADVPMPDRGGWSKSGCIMGDGWSIAWRVHDAQFWGVPQRRKRIALVADFGGLSAPEILFERKGMSRNPEPGETERERVAGRIEDSIGKTGELVVEPRTQDGCARVYRGGVTPTLNTASGGQRQPCVICLQGNGIDRADTAGCNGRGWNDQGVSYTLNTIDRPAIMCLNDQGGAANGGYRKQNRNTHGTSAWTSTVGPLQARDYKGVGNQYVNEGKLIVCHSRPSDS